MARKLLKQMRLPLEFSVGVTVVRKGRNAERKKNQMKKEWEEEGNKGGTDERQKGRKIKQRKGSRMKQIRLNKAITVSSSRSYMFPSQGQVL
jgi:hypothetical protein